VLGTGVGDECDNYQTERLGVPLATWRPHSAPKKLINHIPSKWPVSFLCMGGYRLSASNWMRNGFMKNSISFYLRQWRWVSLVVLPCFLGGCVIAMNTMNPPSQLKLHITSFSPQQYCLRIKDRECRVPGDGRMVVDIPALGHDCSIYLFGACKIKDGSAQNLPAVHVLRDGQCIRTLTLRQVTQLPLDAEGCRWLKLP